MAKSTIMSNDDDVKTSELRLMVLSPTQSPETDEKSNLSPNESKTLFVDFLTHLTGSSPSEDLSSFAGYTSHPFLKIRNYYYNANINLWCDEIISDSKDDVDWSASMCSDEAKEVRQVIGGFVLLLPYNSSSNMAQDIDHIQSILKVRDMVDDESGRELSSIILLQDVTPAAEAERSTSGIADYVQKLEDSCLENHGIFGIDIVSWRPENSATTASSDHANQRNEYGERTGIARVIEVLEQVNWASSADFENHDYGLVSVDDLSDDDFEVPGYKPNILPKDTQNGLKDQSDEFQREIMGLHFALEDQSHRNTDDSDGDDAQVEQLAGLMERVTAMREAGSEMSKADREKFAKREVNKIMRDLNM